MSKQNTWTAICDDERECWAIVDREPGGSQSHDGDGADEHIADVFDPENAASIVNAAAEITRLRAIVDKLPKTEDGVPLLPGDRAYWKCTWGERAGQVLEMHMDSFHATDEYTLSYGWEYCINHQNAGVWSTREAAEKAKEQGNV